MLWHTIVYHLHTISSESIIQTISKILSPSIQLLDKYIWLVKSQGVTRIAIEYTTIFYEVTMRSGGLHFQKWKIVWTSEAAAWASDNKTTPISCYPRTLPRPAWNMNTETSERSNLLLRQVTTRRLLKTANCAHRLAQLQRWINLDVHSLKAATWASDDKTGDGICWPRA